jgi:nitrite reductase/ring-hydroxylating ferredoxin subunit
MNNTLDLKTLTERLLTQLDSKIPDYATDIHREPAAAYTDPQAFARERQILFRHHAVFGGWSAQLPDRDSFKTLTVADVPLLLTRDREGRLHGFRNACRHRGMLLTQTPAGCAARFTCPFHGWTYDSQGKLIGIPSRDAFPGITKDSHSLAPIQVAEKYGLIFLRVEGGEPIDVDEHLAGLGPQLASFGWDTWRAGEQRSLNIPVNWKLIMDGFCEGYHFGIVHAKTLSAVVLTNTHVVDSFGPHIRELFGNHGLLEMKSQPVAARANPRLGADVALIYLIFPNLVLIGLDRGGWEAISIWPGDTVGETFVEEVRLIASDLSPEDSQAIEHRFSFNWEKVIQGEDIPLSIGAWQALKGGSVSELIFGRNEMPLQHLHQHYHRALTP